MDRFDIYAVACSCGQGKYIVEQEEPDHTWRPSVKWNPQITCSECKERFSLRVLEDHVVRVRRGADIASLQPEDLLEVICTLSHPIIPIRTTLSTTELVATRVKTGRTD